MTVLTEIARRGEFLISEGNGDISRDAGTLASGNNLKAGAVLGKVTASGDYAEHDPGASDGTETAVAVLMDYVDASSEDTPALVIARQAEVMKGLLVWKAGATAGQVVDGLADLEKIGIVAR